MQPIASSPKSVVCVSGAIAGWARSFPARACASAFGSGAAAKATFVGRARAVRMASVRMVRMWRPTHAVRGRYVPQTTSAAGPGGPAALAGNDRSLRLLRGAELPGDLGLVLRLDARLLGLLAE